MFETLADFCTFRFLGLSAAIGKAGAAVGTQVFQPIEDGLGQRWTFIIAAIVGVVGILVTYFFVPNLTGDDLAIEDERFRVRISHVARVNA